MLGVGISWLFSGLMHVFIKFFTVPFIMYILHFWFWFWFFSGYLLLASSTSFFSPPVYPFVLCETLMSSYKCVGIRPLPFKMFGVVRHTDWKQWAPPSLWLDISPYWDDVNDITISYVQIHALKKNEYSVGLCRLIYLLWVCLITHFYFQYILSF